MASHDLELGTIIKTEQKISEQGLTVRQINGPLVSVKYPNGNFAGIINKSAITHIKVDNKWEEYIA